MCHVVQRLPLSHPALSIICTAGPSIFKAVPKDNGWDIGESKMEELLDKGMGIVRINFSHVEENEFDEIDLLIKHIRELEDKRGIPIPILMDLAGPEIRITEILYPNKKGKLEQLPEKTDFNLEIGDHVIFSVNADGDGSLRDNAKARVIVSFEGNFYSEVRRGNTVVIGDNDLYLSVRERYNGSDVLCITENSGSIKIKKSINLPDSPKLDVENLVEKDMNALKRGFDVDLIAQSFVQEHEDVNELIGFLRQTTLKYKPIIVKVETPSAVKDIDKILKKKKVFGIMVARGDLGVLVDFKKIPRIQKRLIDAANRLGKPVIVATQMLESMVHRPKPWRPEVQDISTAINEGADSLMLSEETAIGQFPEETVEVMSEVIKEYTPVDRDEYLRKFDNKYALPNPKRPIDVIGYAICEVAKEANSPFIFSYATTGISATLISRFRPKVPVIAITNRQDTARILSLLYNVYPVLVKEKDLPRQPREFIAFLRDLIAELNLGKYIKEKRKELEREKKEVSSLFLVGTQELSTIVGDQYGDEDFKARGIFVFEPYEP